MLAKRKMTLTQLADAVGITIANLSVLKTGKAKAIRITTLEKICRALDCQPGDLLEFRAAVREEIKDAFDYDIGELTVKEDGGEQDAGE